MYHVAASLKWRLFVIFAVLASDGLWDTHTNEEVVFKVRQSIKNRSGPSIWHIIDTILYLAANVQAIKHIPQWWRHNILNTV
jgi:serine/threonine protein phosphatase PrpC